MDKYWELVDEVYKKGWESKGQTDYDPRGTAEWQTAVDAFDVIKQRLADAEAKLDELDKELFIFASDVIYFEHDKMPDRVFEKAKAIYDRPRLGKG